MSLLKKKKEEKENKKEKEKKVSRKEKKLQKEQVKNKKEKKEKEIKKDTNTKEKKKNIFSRILGYFKGVKKEVSRIRWTKGKEMLKYSVAAVAITPTAIAAAPIAIFAQLGREQLPLTSKRLTGLFIQYANIL